MTTITFADSLPAVDPALAARGWLQFSPDAGGGGFDRRLGEFLVRRAPDGSAEARIETGEAHTNMQGGLHGGFQAMFIEKCLHLPLWVNASIDRGGVLVVDLSVNYLIPGKAGVPLLSQTWLLRETGRMGFVRGELQQDGETITGYTGILRKLPKAG